MCALHPFLRTARGERKGGGRARRNEQCLWDVAHARTPRLKCPRTYRLGDGEARGALGDRHPHRLRTDARQVGVRHHRRHLHVVVVVAPAKGPSAPALDNDPRRCERDTPTAGQVHVGVTHTQTEEASVVP